MIQKGEAVRDWQKDLSEAGYDPGAIDGNWGPKTSNATKKFQADNALVPDGKVGDKTRAAMADRLAGRQIPEQEIKSGAQFWKTPLFWVAASGAAFVAFTAWRDEA
jgi:peptidoglycan hydrolase-like protein with peptidoglycan-binding domain